MSLPTGQRTQENASKRACIAYPRGISRSLSRCPRQIATGHVQLISGLQFLIIVIREEINSFDMLEETSIGMANFCNFNLKNLLRNVAVRSVSSVLRIFCSSVEKQTRKIFSITKY